MSLTFRERYCALHQIAVGDFEDHLLRRSLYFHARPLRGVLALLPDYFAADREFLRSVGDIRSRRLFHAEAGEYHAHPANRSLLRRWLRLRVSAERVRVNMEASWQGHGTASPVAGNLSAR